MAARRFLEAGVAQLRKLNLIARCGANIGYNFATGDTGVAVAATFNVSLATSELSDPLLALRSTR